MQNEDNAKDDLAQQKKQDEALAPLRKQIDGLDRDLVRLLNERAKVVLDVGRVKHETGGAIFVPHRERAVFERIRGLSEGPLPDRCLEAIWRELMSGSFALERPLRIGYLGPAGSFTHQAAESKFGLSVEYDNLRELSDVFDAVERGHLDYGVVPIENSLQGSVAQTLDLLGQRQVKVCAEIMLRIRHCLLANCDAPEITHIASHELALAQCRNWLQAQFPKAIKESVSSTSRAVELAYTKPGAAAIGSVLAGKLYDVRVQFEDIADRTDNTTRFYVIAKQETEVSGNDKTAICFVVPHHPGALVEVLSVFHQHKINMSHIDKRPIQDRPWEYMFFVDIQGHASEEAIQVALKEVRERCHFCRVLGSFPRAEVASASPASE